MRLPNVALLQKILMMSAMMTLSSSADVEQAARRLACPQSTAVELTTFSFEYWIAVGSIGSISVNVLPTLDAYIVEQVEKKIEWCNQVDLMHLMSGAGESETASGPLIGSEVTDRFGESQGHRDLSVVSFVHSGLEYPSNCPCAQNPVINDINTTDTTCQVAMGTLYFALCQDNVEYMCPIIRGALEETLAMDTPFMTDNDDLSYLYYYGDNHEDSFSQLELCPQPDILTDNIGRRPMPSDLPMASDESNTGTGTEATAPSSSADATQVVDDDDIVLEDSNTESIDDHEITTKTPPENTDTVQGEQTTGGQTENLDTNLSSDTPSQTPTSSNDNVAPSAENETTPSQTPTSSSDNVAPSATNESTESQSPTVIAALLPPKEETNEGSTDITGTTDDTPTTTTSPATNKQETASSPSNETTGVSDEMTGETKDSPSTTTSPASGSSIPNTTSKQETQSDQDQAVGYDQSMPSSSGNVDSSLGATPSQHTGPSANSTESSQDSISGSPTLMPSNKSATVNVSKSKAIYCPPGTIHANVSGTSPSSVVDQTEIQLPISDAPSDLPSNRPSDTSPSSVVDQTEIQLPISDAPSDLPSDRPSEYPSLIPSATPISNRLPLNLSPATYPSVIPSNKPPTTINTPTNVESSLPSFSMLPTMISLLESASPFSSNDEGVIVTGPEVGDAVTAPEEEVVVTNSQEADNFMVICLGVGIPILLALLVGGYYAKTRPTTMEDPLAKDVQVLSTLSSLVGTGDPPGSFHEGAFHFMADGTRYLSTRCEECRTTRQNRCFVDSYLRTIHENEIYDDTMSLSLSSESTYSRPVNTHTTSTSASCLQISQQHNANNVHYCTSATCQKCNSNSPQKQPTTTFVSSPVWAAAYPSHSQKQTTTTFVSSPVWAAYPSHQGRRMRSLNTEIENEESFHSEADSSSDSVISSWDQVKVPGDKVPEKIATSWEEGEAEV